MEDKKEIYRSERKKNNMDKKEVKCSKCGYVWRTESKLIFTNCPSCRRSTRIN